MLDFSRQAVDFTRECRRIDLDTNAMLMLAITRRLHVTQRLLF
jgi:hypothetical protein